MMTEAQKNTLCDFLKKTDQDVIRVVFGYTSSDYVIVKTCVPGTLEISLDARIFPDGSFTENRWMPVNY